MGDKKSRKKRVFRWLAVGLVCVLAAVVLSLLLLTLGPGERWLKEMAEARMQDALGQEVNIGWLETNLLSRLQLRDVRIYEAQAEKTIPFLTLGYAKVEYSLADLVHRRLIVKSLELDSLKLTIQRDSLGVLNLPKSEPSARADSMAAEPPLHIRLGNVSLRNSSLEYLDRVMPIEAYLKNLAIMANYKKDETYQYNMQTDSVGAEYRGIPIMGKQMKIAGLLSGRQLRVDSISVDLPGLQFTGNAEALVGADTSIAGDFRLQGNPDQLLQAAGELFPKPLPPVGGDLDLALHVQGSLSRPEVSAKLELKRFDVASIRIQRALAEASWQADLVDLQKLRLELLGGTISGKGSVSTDSLFAHQLSMSVDGVDLAEVWQSLYGESGPCQGKIKAKLKTSGQSQDPTKWKVQADLNLKEAKYNLKPVPDLSAIAVIDKGLAKLSFHQEDSEAEAQVKLQDEQIDGEFWVKIVELEPLAGLADIAELNGGLEMQGVFSGKLDSPAMQAEIEARNVRYQNFPLDSLKGTIIYRDGQARIQGLRFAGNLSPIDSLKPPFHMASIRGEIVYQGQVGGTVDSLTGDVTVDLTELRYADMGLDQGFIGIVLENQRINLSSLLLRSDSLLIRGSGEFDIQSRKGTSQINLVKIPLSGYNLKDNISDLVQELDDSQMPMPLAGKLTAEFDLSDMNRLSLKMQADGVDLERIRILLPQAQEIGGLLGFNLNFSGNMDSPQAELDFHLRKPRFRSMEMDSLKGHLSFANQRFRFEPVELHDRGNYSQIRGMVELEKRADGTYFVSDSSLIEGQAKGENLDLSLLSAFMAEGAQISGRGSFDLSWNGTLGNPGPAGIFSIDNGLVQPDSARPGVKQISLNLSLQDSIADIQNLSGVIQETPFNLKARITASQWKNFDVQMNLAISDFGAVTGEGTVSRDSLGFDLGIKQMDLSLFLPFTTDLYKLSGSLDMEIRLSGSPQDPELDGRLEIRDLLVQPVFLNIPLDRGVIKLRFDKNRVMVDSLFVQMDAGFLFASGVLSHERGEFSDVNLQATMSNLRIDRPKELIALIESARFDYRRQNNYYLLDGDMTLGECRMLVNFRPQSILSFVRAVEKPSKELSPLLQQTRLDVRVRESEKIWIDNNLARLRLHTELGIIGSPVQPNVTGRVSVEEGYILYLDRKFNVKNGVVDFVDPDRLNPIIDFSAEATVKTYRATEMTPYTVTIAIAGPLDEVVVELKSEPPLDRSNILSLLTLGVTRDELVGKDTEGKEGSLSSALLERAQSFSSQKISGYTAGKLGDLLGLDQMSVEGNLFRFDKSWGPQLLASKRISRRMTMAYITTVGHFNERSIRLDYELSRHFSLEGETDQRGRSGMNLKYKLRSK
jgi:autotransporter translocation and assembly factor TamB